jgi:phosphate transport system substrate-binding protein
VRKSYIERKKMFRLNFKVAAVAIPAALLLAACGGTTADSTASSAASAPAASAEIRIDGSSTVAPLSAAAGELFKVENPSINVSVGTSGTGGGFAKFCAGETDISNASRQIKDEEAAECAAAGIEFTEIVVANDALTVVVNKENDWATCLTIEELNKMWAPESEGTVTSWSQIRAGFPDVPLDLYGAGTDSGTFDYFTKEINGEEGASRTDYNPTEDDNVTVQGVEGAQGAIGYFGLSYFEENADKLTAVEIDGGAGCVAPNSANAQAGTYAPLGRPLFIYASKSAAAKPEVLSFLEFYVANNEAITTKALFVPLSAEQKTAAQAAVAGLK